jgi:hypothetical protein
MGSLVHQRGNGGGALSAAPLSAKAERAIERIQNQTAVIQTEEQGWGLVASTGMQIVTGLAAMEFQAAEMYPHVSEDLAAIRRGYSLGLVSRLQQRM